MYILPETICLPDSVLPEWALSTQSGDVRRGLARGTLFPLSRLWGGVGDHSETVPHVLGTFATKVPPRRDNCEARNLIFVMLYKKPMDHFSSTGFILQATLHNSH